MESFDVIVIGGGPGGTVYGGKHLIIATGSSNVVPPLQC